MSPTTLYAVVGTLFALAALANWWAVVVRNYRVMVVAKPLTLIALIGIALIGGAGDETAGRWLLLGLVLCLAGDVFLLGDGEKAFLAGLSSFLLGHIAYVATFVVLGLAEPAWGLIGVMTLIAAAPWIVRVVPAAHRDGGVGLAGAVTAYTLVIGAMVVLAWMTGHWLIGLGATTFMVSDTVLAVNRFVERRRLGDLAVMVTYHLGQLLIVLGVLSALP
ncbi:MAG: lysoplasmalogenase [Intrasporangiaceae bacterium]|nr:lysoplasmalogenase [Intrasporangiaceae bacterium]